MSHLNIRRFVTKALAIALAVLGLLPINFSYVYAADVGNITVNDSTPWPASNPYPAALSAEVAACQTAVGKYDAQGVTRWFDLTAAGGYQAMTKFCLTGVAWFKDTPAAGKVENAAATSSGTGASTTVNKAPAATKLGECANLGTREARLDCATQKYFDNGSGLAGIKAYMTALGATFDAIVVGDPFQPDATPLPSGSPRIWGALLKATNLRVSGPSCLVTDVPTRIASFGWAMVDDRYSPRPSVWHAGEATTVGSMTEIAFHGDCSDWPENVEAMARGGEYHPYPTGAGNPPAESVAAAEETAAEYTTTAGCLMPDGATVPNDYTVRWNDGKEQVCKAGQLVDKGAEPEYKVVEQSTGPNAWQRLTNWLGRVWPWIVWPIVGLVILGLVIWAIASFIRRNNERADEAARSAAAQRRPAEENPAKSEQQS